VTDDPVTSVDADGVVTESRGRRPRGAPPRVTVRETKARVRAGAKPSRPSGAVLVLDLTPADAAAGEEALLARARLAVAASGTDITRVAWRVGPRVVATSDLGPPPGFVPAVVARRRAG
jgi:hypothetical protein